MACRFRCSASNSNCQLRRGRRGVGAPFFLSLIDEELVQIGTMDENGSPRAVLETMRPSIREWAEGLFGRARNCARVLSADAG